MQTQLFGSSGIRGIVNVELSPLRVSEIGSSLATMTNGGKVIVGRDTRVSSPMLEKALISGLIAGGCHVVDLGIVPTPVLAYLTKDMMGEAGVMITASHNPPEYNGVKFFNGDGMAYSDEQQLILEEIYIKRRFRLVPWDAIGSKVCVNEANRYVSMLTSNIHLSKRWRVVMDCGSGSTCYLAPRIMRALGCNVIALNAQPDGYFPGRSPEPTSESTVSLQASVQRLGADIGVAFDGDGDRMMVIDENGVFVSPDQLLAAYAGYSIRREGGGNIITQVDASMCIEQLVESLGGKVVRTKVGDVYIAIGIKRHGGIFGGEPCGAWIHPRYSLCPDGPLSFALLLQALEETGKTLSQFISTVPAYPILRKKIACPNELKIKVVKHLQETLPAAFPNMHEMLTVDGIRLRLAEGWLLIRASGTEPALRVTVEARTPGLVKRLFDTCSRIVSLSLREVRKA
ncbi:phosphoglucosamine mutase [Candidatus Bathyarchaeota archaeon]|nr:phosphoglucosamine mutase [Candidatus Bathyarchaeota archaeon]